MTSAKPQIVIQPKRKFFEFALFSTLEDMKSAIEKGEQLSFSAKRETKTMISTVLHCGKTEFNVNLDLEGFNLRERQEYNMLACGYKTNILFKLTKTQNKEEYLNYIAAVVDWVFKKIGLERQQEVFNLCTDVFDSQPA
jgi:hypothetical protein